MSIVATHGNPIRLGFASIFNKKPNLLVVTLLCGVSMIPPKEIVQLEVSIYV